MKKKLLVLFLAVFAAAAFAEEFTLNAFRGQREWKKTGIVPVPGSVEFKLDIDYVGHGPTQLFPFLKFYDKDRKQIGRELLCRAPLHYVAKEDYGKKCHRTFIVPVHNIPAGTASMDLRLSALSTGMFRNENASITVIDPKVSFVYRMEPVNRMGFFELKKGVCFRSVLPPGMKAVKGTVFDSEGRQIFQSVSKDGVWKFPARQPGFYTVKFAWIDGNGKAVPCVESVYVCKTTWGKVITHYAEKAYPRDSRSFVVTAGPRRKAAEGFGFNCGFQSPYDLRLTMQDQFDFIRAIGWDDFIRAHWAAWHKIEKVKGEYDWSGVDELFRVAAANNIPQNRIVLDILGTPHWNSPRKKTNGIWTNASYYCAPEDLKPWGDFVAATLKRYPNLMGLELWNEPHVKGGSVFWQDSTVKRFVELMQTGYEAAKRTSPETPVVMGGIGMRYFPFFQEYVPLGGSKYVDYYSSHCGYDMRTFAALDKRINGKAKPWWELEWHTVLYNCGIQQIPSEEECTFRMLINMADLLYMGYEKIAAFGMFCGDHVPETSRHFAQMGGIQQIAGLFRNVPYIEPRQAACAMRTAGDRFSGKVKCLGAWNYADQWQGVLFESASGKVLFFWCSNEKGNGKLPAPLAAALKKAKIITWEGKTVSANSLRPRRVYFAENPDAAMLKKGRKHAGQIQMAPIKPVLDRSVNGCYGNDRHAKNMTEFYSYRKGVAPISGKFNASFSPSGMKLVVEVKDAKHVADSPNLQFWNYDSLQFAIDAVGDGFNEDVLEFTAGNNGQIYKTRMPVLRGDLPEKYSDAGKLLTDSKAVITHKNGVTRYEINVSSGDLYPFIYSPGKAVRFTVIVNNNDGNGREGFVRWGKGIGDGTAAHKFGTLVPCGEPIRRIDVSTFQEADIQKGSIYKITAKGSGKGAGGICFSIPNPAAGGCYHFSCEVRGKGNFEGMYYTGILKRQNMKHVKLSDKWQKMDYTVFLPAGKNGSLVYALFFWRQPTAYAEIRNLKIETF